MARRRTDAPPHTSAPAPAGVASLRGSCARLKPPLLRGASGGSYSRLFPRLDDDSGVVLSRKTSFRADDEDHLDPFDNSPRPLTCIADATDLDSPTAQAPPMFTPRATGKQGARTDSTMMELESAAAHDIDEALVAEIVDLQQPFPFDEVDYNRCALQLSSETSLDEIHSLFSFMSMGHVWITAGGKLCGVVSDRSLIEACLPAAAQA